MDNPSALPPLFSPGGVILGGGLQFLFGRAPEARKHLTVQVSQCYADYFRAVALLAQGETKEANSLAVDAKVRICLYGSSSVIESLRRFDDVGASIDTPEGHVAIAELAKSMRQSLGEDDGTISNEPLQQVLVGSRARAARKGRCKLGVPAFHQRGQPQLPSLISFRTLNASASVSRSTSAGFPAARTNAASYSGRGHLLISSSMTDFFHLAPLAQR